MNFIKPHDPEFVRPLQIAETRPYGWIPEFQAFLGRRWGSILGCLVACLLLGIVVLVFLPPNFTASAQVLFDSRRADPFHQQNGNMDAQVVDGLVESQVEILRSDGLARKVVERLNLTEDAAFLAMGHSLRTELEAPFFALLQTLQGKHSGGVEDKVQLAANILTNQTTVRRVGLTYVINVDVRAHDPQMAAKLANGLTAAYVAVQLEAKYDVTRTAGDWLRTRSNTLRQDALAADHAVQDYKAQNNIVDTDKGLLNEQELAELNSSLVTAHTQSSEIAARHIADPYRNNLQIARDAEKNIQSRIDRLVRQAASTNSQRVTLRALESSADTYRSLYENFLQRYSQAVQEQSFPVSETQVVTAATPPMKPSSPTPVIVLPVSVILGLGLGFALGFVRESAKPGLHTARQLRAATGLNCIGLVPRLSWRELRFRPRRPVVTDGGPAPRLLRAHRLGLRYAVERPQSEFAQTIGGVSSRLMHLSFAYPNRKIVGCVARLGGEGTTTVAANIAHMLARRGQRTILIDGHPGVTSLTTILAPGATRGMPEVLAGEASIAEIVLHDDQTGLDFLPAGGGQFAPKLAEMLSSPGIEAVLGDLRASYDHIVFDLPPLMPIPNTQMIASVIDAFVLVVAWGQTDQNGLNEGLALANFDELRSLGAVMNKVDLKVAHESAARV